VGEGASEAPSEGVFNVPPLLSSVRVTTTLTPPLDPQPPLDPLCLDREGSDGRALTARRCLWLPAHELR
jgi:hypothetical protein